MCRNIKPLYNFEPPATEEDIRAASLQFVRKISGFNKPCKANEAAFETAVDEITAVSRNLLSSLKTNAPLKSRTGPHLRIYSEQEQQHPSTGVESAASGNEKDNSHSRRGSQRRPV